MKVIILGIIGNVPKNYAKKKKKPLKNWKINKKTKTKKKARNHTDIISKIRQNIEECLVYSDLLLFPRWKTKDIRGKIIEFSVVNVGGSDDNGNASVKHITEKEKKAF